MFETFFFFAIAKDRKPGLEKSSSVNAGRAQPSGPEAARAVRSRGGEIPKGRSSAALGKRRGSEAADADVPRGLRVRTQGSRASSGSHSTARVSDPLGDSTGERLRNHSVTMVTLFTFF